MRLTLRCGRCAALGRIAAVVLALLVAVGGGGDGGYDSTPFNEDVPVVGIANLPDIDQTTAQMLNLIEQIRAEVTRLVPASAPWEWTREQSGHSCVQQETGRKGVSRSLRNLVSEHAFSDREWTLVFPAVRQLAIESGLTDIAAPQNEPGNHDMRFSSDDGRTVMFGSRVASVVTGKIACRRAAESPPS